jgi:hypothetical protein
MNFEQEINLLKQNIDILKNDNRKLKQDIDNDKINKLLEKD